MRDPPHPAAIGLLLVAVLCVSAVAGAGLTGATSTDAAGQQGTIPVENSTNYLSPDSENLTRQAFGQAGVDLGAAVRADAERLEARHNRLSDDALREEAPTPARAAERIVDRVERRIDSLDERQAQLFSEFSSGAMSTRTLLAELSALEVAARQQREAVGELQAQSLSGALSTQVDRLEVETALLPNPVSDRLAGAATGATDPIEVYLGATPNALVAATVVDGRYVRQTTLRNERERGGEDQFAAQNPDVPPQAAFSRASELYSWAGKQNADSRGFSGTSVYVFRSNHSHGDLSSYLDGATTNPFHESQSKRSAVVPVTETRTNTDQSLRLNVQYTDPTGPMLVSLIGSGGTLPPSATVTVNDQPVGQIAGGGQLWTVQPIGSFRVAVTTDRGEAVSVTVQPS